MKKVLVAYFSLYGNTENMARYIAEGIRINGQEAIVKKTSSFKEASDLNPFDGYIFGSPTHFRDVAEPMKKFLFLARNAQLVGKLAGAFGSYTHDGNAAAIIFDTMQYVFHMEPFELGPLKLKESAGAFPLNEVDVDSTEGLRACQAYGKVFAAKLGS